MSVRAIRTVCSVCVCVLWFFIDSYYCVVASCVSKIVAQTQRRLLRDQNNLPQKFIIIRAIFTLSPEPISIKKFCDVFHFPLFFLFFLLSLWLFLGSCISHSDTFAWCLRHMYVSSFRLPLLRVSNDSCQFPVDAFCRTDASFPFSPIACSYSSLQILISFNWGLRWYVRRDGLREMFFSAIMSAAFMINASVLFTVCTSGVCVCVCVDDKLHHFGRTGMESFQFGAAFGETNTFALMRVAWKFWNTNDANSEPIQVKRNR